MNKIVLSIMLCILLSTSSAIAASFDFDGNIEYHNDVVEFGFSLDNDAIVRIWTDSYRDGAGNFDPMLTIWTANTNSWVAFNDDYPYISTEQDWYDSGFNALSLVAGDYLVSLTQCYNIANQNYIGGLLSAGFSYDNSSISNPIPFNQSYYHVNFENVDYASDQTQTAPVPEPATILLMGMGLAGIAGFQRKRISKKETK